MKDILDAIKNQTILSVVLGMGMMLISVQALPWLIKFADKDRVVIYDAGATERVSEWHGRRQLVISEVDSQSELEEMLRRMNSQVLGVVLPAGLDRQLESETPVSLDGYLIWSARNAADEMEVVVTEHLEALLEHPVRLELAGHRVYPTAGAGGGQMAMVSIALLMVMAIGGCMMVPYLLFEEKGAHTMEAMLVSPATAGQITVGKALAGLFYCLAALLVAFAFNYAVVVNWWAVILTAVVGSMVAIAIGLLLGSLFESAQQMSLWAIFPVALWLAPVFFLVVDVRLPAGLDAAIRWLPSSLIAENFHFAFYRAVVWETALLNLALLAAWSLPFFWAVARVVRRSDR